MFSVVVVAVVTVSPPEEMVEEALEMKPSLNVVSPLTVVVSVGASPNVVLPSTEKVEAVVVESVTEPTEVIELAYRSPSASMRNLIVSPTAAAKRLESAVALAGLMSSDASKSAELDAPVVHEENV